MKFGVCFGVHFLDTRRQFLSLNAGARTALTKEKWLQFLILSGITAINST